MDASAADAVWGGILVAGAAFEVYAIFNETPGDTLSERTRSWFRVRTKFGAIFFGVGWCAFATWFLFHILS